MKRVTRRVVFKFLTWMFSSIQYVIYCSFLGAYMSNKEFECPQCCKRYKNAGGLKTHMKTHKKPEPKSGSMLKWVVKRAKSEIKPRPSMAIDWSPLWEPGNWNSENHLSVNRLLLQIHPLRIPRRSKQPPLDASPFMAPTRLTDPDLAKRSP